MSLVPKAIGRCLFVYFFRNQNILLNKCSKVVSLKLCTSHILTLNIKKEKQMHSMPSLLYVFNSKYNTTESWGALEQQTYGGKQKGLSTCFCSPNPGGSQFDLWHKLEPLQGCCNFLGCNGYLRAIALAVIEQNVVWLSSLLAPMLGEQKGVAESQHRQIYDSWGFSHANEFSAAQLE